MQYLMYYPLPQWSEHLTTINNFLRADDPLLLVLGERGVGKTSFLAHFMTRRRDTMTTLQLRGNIKIDVSRLIDLLARHCCVEIDRNLPRQQQLDKLLQILRAGQNLGLLIIDDAHQLPLDSLAALIYLINSQQEGSVCLHVILLGPYQLCHRIKELSLQETLIESLPRVEISVLSFQETYHYLSYRLSQLGFSANVFLSDDQVRRIHNQSKGIPAVLNTVVETWGEPPMPQKSTSSKSVALSMVRTSGFRGRSIRVACASLLALFTVGLWYSTNHWMETSVVSTARASSKLPSTAQSNELVNELSMLSANASTSRQLSQILPKSVRQQSQDYSLQIMGMRSLAPLQQFVRHHGLENARIFATHYLGEPWYVLTFGHFPNVKQAISAKKQLPVYLKRLAPWPREIKNLHEVS